MIHWAPLIVLFTVAIFVFIFMWKDKTGEVSGLLTVLFGLFAIGVMLWIMQIYQPKEQVYTVIIKHHEVSPDSTVCKRTYTNSRGQTICLYDTGPLKH